MKANEGIINIRSEDDNVMGNDETFYTTPFGKKATYNLESCHVSRVKLLLIMC